jgi:hypothetical protein
MERLRGKIQIRHVYYTHEDEIHGIRCVKFCKLVKDPERHYSSFERNVSRRHNFQNLRNLRNLQNQKKN